MEQDKINKYSWYLFQIIMLSAFFFDSDQRVSILIFCIQSIGCLLFLVWLDKRKYQYSLEFSALMELCYTIISLGYTFVVSMLFSTGSKFHVEGLMGVIWIIILNLPIVANIVLAFKSIKGCRDNIYTDFQHTLINNAYKIISPVIIIVEIIYILIALNGTRLSVVIICFLLVLLIIRLVVKNTKVLRLYSLCWLLLLPIIPLLFFSSMLCENVYSFFIDVNDEQLFYLMCIEPIHIMAGTFEVINVFFVSRKISTK